MMGLQVRNQKQATCKQTDGMIEHFNTPPSNMISYVYPFNNRSDNEEPLAKFALVEENLE